MFGVLGARGVVERRLARRTVKRDGVLVVASFAAVYLVWGSTYLAIAWAVETIPPMAMIGARCLVAGAVLYGWTRLRGGPRPTATDWRAAALAGTLMFVLGQAVLAWAETRVASGPAALIVATEPLFVVLLTWIGGPLAGSAVRGERPKPRGLVAVVVGFLGVAIMVLPGGVGAVDAVGAGATLFAAAAWSIGIFHARPRPGLSAVQAAGMQLLAAGAVLVPVSLGLREQVDVAAVSARSFVALAYLVVFGSVITFAAYVWLLDRVGPGRLSTHAYVNPVVAVVLGATLAGEAVTPSIVAAMALILASVLVLVRRQGGSARKGGASDRSPAPHPASAPVARRGRRGRRAGAA